MLTGQSSCQIIFLTCVKKQTWDTNAKTVMLFSIQGERKQKGKLECFSQLGGKERARLLNKMSRAIFPASFLVFNIIWLIGLYICLWNITYSLNKNYLTYTILSKWRHHETLLQILLCWFVHTFWKWNMIDGTCSWTEINFSINLMTQSSVTCKSIFCGIGFSKFNGYVLFLKLCNIH